jgi:hypothetical protein
MDQLITLDCPWHLSVCYQQVYATSLAHLLQGLFRVRCNQNAIASTTQGQRRNIADLLVIFNQKYGFAAAAIKFTKI